jgi:hypothetical protein
MKIFTLIPKHFISKAAGSLNIIQNNILSTTQSSDISFLNKQEERVINAFNNVNNESNFLLNINSSFIILSTSLIACHLASIYLLINIYDSTFLNIRTEIRHFSSLTGACSYQVASTMGFYSWMGAVAGAGPQEMLGEAKNKNIYSRLIMRGKLSSTFYNQARNGFDNISIGPFASFSQIITEINQNTPCIQKQQIPKSYHDSYDCLTTDMKFTLFFHFIQKITSEFMENQSMEISLKTEEYDSL